MTDLLSIFRSARNLKRGVAVRFGVRRVCLVRSETVFGTEMYCGQRGYAAPAARGRLCDGCRTEARRVGFDL